MVVIVVIIVPHRARGMPALLTQRSDDLGTSPPSVPVNVFQNVPQKSNPFQITKAY